MYVCVNRVMLLNIFNSNCIYGISPNKRSRGYAKHRWGAFILYPICKAKSLSNFEYLFVLDTFKTKY